MQGKLDLVHHGLGNLEATERQLGITLAFVAGAVNAGGFMVVGQYTSHMSGIVSAIADHSALGAWRLVLAGLLALLSFTAGAACSAMMINWGRRHHRRSQYALPLLLEILLLLSFGLISGLAGIQLSADLVIVPLLCFLMGLQNALITKVSGARIRTTHVTGIVTDIGIELGKLAYWNRHGEGATKPFVRADRGKLKLLGSLLTAFFVGGVSGAFGFAHVGALACLPLALILLLLSSAIIRVSN